MKKVLLMTWIGKGNFGTCLQSFALNTFLKNQGFDVSILSHLPLKYDYKSYLKFALHNFGLDGFIEYLHHKSDSTQIMKRRKFQKLYYREVKVFTKKQEVELENKYDCFLAGSDQIWNTYFSLFNSKYFLSFVKKKKRIAYASSIGTNSIKEEHKITVRNCLLGFSCIGVRETEAVSVLSKLTGRTDIRQVLDPTFLLEPNEWRKMAKGARYEMRLPKNYILCYFIGNNKWYSEQLSDVIKCIGINDVVLIPSAESPDFAIDNVVVYQKASPIEFVDLIQRAKYVCTDSFHATALCINNSIQFVEFMRFNDDDKMSQNSRIYNLLGHYGLMNRIYSKDIHEWANPILYYSIQDKLSQDRKNSIKFLVDAIEN